jgi:DNA-binding NtrC family response regulator
MRSLSPGTGTRLRKLRMERFDIVITDLMMPGMDGLALLQKVKDLDKEILVIITGYATIETAVEAIESGARLHRQTIQAR